MRLPLSCSRSPAFAKMHIEHVYSADENNDYMTYASALMSFSHRNRVIEEKE